MLYFSPLHNWVYVVIALPFIFSTSKLKLSCFLWAIDFKHQAFVIVYDLYIKEIQFKKKKKG